MRRLLLALILAAAMLPFAPGTAQAHGSCTVYASFDGPNSSDKWRGHGSIYCTDQHPIVFVDVQLQSRNCIGCPWNDMTGLGADVCNGLHCDANSAYDLLCWDKQYRAHATGYVKSDSGNKHNGDADFSPIKDGYHVGGSC